MGYTRGIRYMVLIALAVILVIVEPSPVLAETVSYGFDATFSVTTRSIDPPTGALGGDDRAIVNDPQRRVRQDIKMEYPDGINPKTLSCAATVSPPINSASARTTGVVNPYSVNPSTGIWTMSGGYAVSGTATAIQRYTNAFASSSAFARFQGVWTGPDGVAHIQPAVEVSSGVKFGQVEVIMDLICQVNVEALEHLLQGVIELAGDTRLNWDSNVPEQNFTIYAPAKSGNNVHFLLKLPGPYTPEQASLEVIIKDGILKSFDKKGTLFDAVDVLHGGDSYDIVNLGPLTINYNIGDIGNNNPDVRLELQTQGRGQLALGANVMPGIELLLMD